MKYGNKDILTVGDNMVGIKELGGCTLKELQGLLFKLLKEADRICRKNNLEYYLMFGSLLGAVRHNGFIPWDDDADIAMTRTNFNRFRECCERDLGDEFALVTYYDEGYNNTYARLRLKNTTFIITSEISKHAKETGIFVDIIVMDYLSNKRFKSHIQKRAAMALHRLVSPGYYQSEVGLNLFEDIMVSISKAILGKKRSVRNAERILSSVKPEESDSLIAGLLVPAAGRLYIYDKQYFEGGISAPFEGVLLNIPNCPLKLLHEVYCRTSIMRGCLIESEVGDEEEKIVRGNLHYLDDILLIPRNRNRARHLEVIFDINHGCDYYDSEYYPLINKKENDRFAIKERRSREKTREIRKKMSENVVIAREACRGKQCRDYLDSLIQQFGKAGNVPLDKVKAIADVFSTVNIPNIEAIMYEQATFALGILARSGNTITAKRYLMVMHSLGYDYGDEYSYYKRMIEKQEIAFNAIFEKKTELLEEYVAGGYDDLFSGVLQGILLYFENKIDEARSIFAECRRLDDSSFWADYYMGLITMEESPQEAKEYFANALDYTLLMPLIDLAIDKISEIDMDRSVQK